MKRGECFELIHQLYAFFHMYDTPSARTIDDWHTEIKHVNFDAVPYIKKQIYQRETLPRNIPLAIKGIYSEWKRINDLKSQQEFDKNEDLRFPVKKLETAIEIYQVEGPTAFNEFCDRVRMPRKDRERCEFQATGGAQFDTTKLVAKIGKRVDEMMKPTPIAKRALAEKGINYDDIVKGGD